MTEKKSDKPITFNISFWWAFGFSFVFILYGGVKMVLSFLDRNYADIAQPIIFLLIGLILITLAFAYKERKQWSWYAQIGVNGLIILLAIIGFQRMENIIILILAGIAMFSLFSSSTKRYLFNGQ